MMSFFQRNLSITALVLANLVPLLGVVFFGWTVESLLLTYWCESGVIGFYILLKMLVSGINRRKEWGLSAIPVTLMFMAFFLVHYSGFMIAHVSVLLSLMSREDVASEILENFPLINLNALYAGLVAGGASLLTVLGLFVSHGISFMVNFIGKKEFAYTEPHSLLLSPYKRIVLMHIIMIIGAGVTLVYGLPVYLLGVFVFAKIFVDIRAHQSEHKAVLQ